MKVSVIIPSTRLEFLGETIDSIKKQTVPAHEIIVLNGQKSLGDKVNQLAEQATGDALLILSDDDLLGPTFIEKTSEKMDEGFDVVYTDMQRFGDSNNIVHGSPYTMENFKISTVPWITSLIRKSDFFEVGGWDADQDYGDYDLYLRLFKAGKTGYCIHEPLFLYRVHGASGSFNMSHELARQKIKNKHPEIL